MKRPHLMFLGMAAAVIMVLSSAAPAQGVKENKAKSKKHFDRAVKFFTAGEYEDALIDFEASYNYRPHWKLKYNIAMCHYNLKNYLGAAGFLIEFLDEGKGKVPEGQRIHVEGVLEESKSNLGIIRLTGKVPESVVDIDGEKHEVNRSGQEILLIPGEHNVFVALGKSVIVNKIMMLEAGKVNKIEVKESGGAGEQEEGKGGKEVEIKKKEPPVEQPVKKAPAPNKKKNTRTGAWVTLAAGLALIVGGGVTVGLGANEASLMQEAEDEYDEKLDDPAVTQEQLDDIRKRRDGHYDTSKELYNATYGLMAAGGALAVTSIVLFVLSMKKKEAKAETKKKASVLFGPGELALRIAF
ncbi:MAG: hypothetical protein ABIJ56_18805 [Pseudomonadota bacterium]